MKKSRKAKIEKPAFKQSAKNIKNNYSGWEACGPAKSLYSTALWKQKKIILSSVE